jgi:uncharacterized OB-fold protein
LDVPSRPAPTVTEDNAFFWEAARDGRLVAQRCGSCARFRHPPRPVCPFCHSLAIEVVDLRGTGEVYSYSLLHYPQNPRFEYPIVAVLITLDEGIRMVSNLIDVDPGDVRIGLPVEVAFAPADEDLVVPVFRPRAQPATGASGGAVAAAGAARPAGAR